MKENMTYADVRRIALAVKAKGLMIVPGQHHDGVRVNNDQARLCATVARGSGLAEFLVDVGPDVVLDLLDEIEKRDKHVVDLTESENAFAALVMRGMRPEQEKEIRSIMAQRDQLAAKNALLFEQNESMAKVLRALLSAGTRALDSFEASK